MANRKVCRSALSQKRLLGSLNSTAHRVTLPRRLITSGNTRGLLTKSAVSGPLEPPLSQKTLPDFFKFDILANYAERPALISPKELSHSHGGPQPRNLPHRGYIGWDFQEFDRHINALSRGLVGLGIKKGDRVGVIMGNSSAYALLQWACASVGAILVTINTAYSLTQFVQTLKLVSVSHLFVVPSSRSSSYIGMIYETFPELRSQTPGDLQTEFIPSLRSIILVDNDEQAKSEMERMRVRSAVDWREAFIWREDGREARVIEYERNVMQKDEVINLQFTSGTTGDAKAVSLTHHNLLNNGISIGNAMNFTSADVLCNPPPLFHCFGLVLGNLAAWTHGACVVYPSPFFDPPSIVTSLVEEKCTALHGVPTHFLGVLSEIERRRARGEQINLTSLRTGIAAGSPVPLDLMKRLIDPVHGLNLRDLTVAYGMTETSPVSFQSTPADPVKHRIESVGKVAPHVRAKIIDHDGNVVDVGQPGEVVVSGYLLQKGYWNDEEHTAQVMKVDEDGVLWMHTGDEGIMDEEGYLKIVGRIKDIIIRGGENLFPVQIENSITSHPEIREAAAISVPDEKYGEVVGAFIVREPSSDPSSNNASREEIKNHVTKDINAQNAPVWVWFIGDEGIPNDLPKTASGKVMKHVLRDWGKGFASKGIGRV